MRCALTCPRLWRSARARVYQELYFDSTSMFTCLYSRSRHNSKYISSSLSKHPQLWANKIQRLSEFAFFSRNKSDKSHQSLNITSSSNAIAKMLCHTITLLVTPVRLTFVKPRGGEGQNGRLKYPLGSLVFRDIHIDASVGECSWKKGRYLNYCYRKLWQVIQSSKINIKL